MCVLTTASLQGGAAAATATKRIRGAGGDSFVSLKGSSAELLKEAVERA